MAVDLVQPSAETVEAVRVAIYRALARTGRLPWVAGPFWGLADD